MSLSLNIYANFNAAGRPEERKPYDFHFNSDQYLYFPPPRKTKLRLINPGTVVIIKHNDGGDMYILEGKDRRSFMKELRQNGKWGQSLALHKFAKVQPSTKVVTNDTDGDGFIDSEDSCIERPGDQPNGCPEPPDTDGDGFLDHEDTCPIEAGVMPDGCPVMDRDADGFPDDIDSCKDVPETINGFDDKDGCPDEPPSFADLKSTDFFTKVDHRDLLLLLAVAENEFNRDTKANLVKVPPSDANYQAITENRRILINAIKTAFKSLVRDHYQNSTNSSLTKLENHAAQITELWVNGDISKKELSELQKYTFEILGKTRGLKIFPKPIKMERS